MKQKIQMVDLHKQYLEIKSEIDEAIARVVDSCAFIAGADVADFARELSAYCGARFVQPVANGTDALQIALMALDLKPGDEVIVPAFTYAASAEVVALLGLKPVLVDVDEHSFNIDSSLIEGAISTRTRAIIAVHLFGQCCDMEPILRIADRHQIAVIEDNAQGIGAQYQWHNGQKAQSGTMGQMGCTSFFPSKNLGCYGDGGAITTQDDLLAQRTRMIANHGQAEKYKHEIVGCNSRLDTIQAAILRAKLRHLDRYNRARQTAAAYYDNGLRKVQGISIPTRMPYSTHVYHQYTLRVDASYRSALREYLRREGIPSMIYYPYTIDQQTAFAPIARIGSSLEVSHRLTSQVLSLPMHTELNPAEQDYIIDKIKSFFG